MKEKTYKIVQELKDELAKMKNQSTYYPKNMRGVLTFNVPQKIAKRTINDPEVKW